jgi:hypothetical protein
MANGRRCPRRAAAERDRLRRRGRVLIDPEHRDIARAIGHKHARSDFD